MMDFTALCVHLMPEERLRLFDMLCGVFQKRLPERVSLALSIPRTHVYRYLQRNGKERRVPSAKTTAKIIDALRGNGYNQAVLPILEPAIERMRISAKAYQNWMRGMKRLKSPFSQAEIERIEWSLSPRRMHF
jgi:hypothetical protein